MQETLNCLPGWFCLSSLKLLAVVIRLGVLGVFCSVRSAIARATTTKIQQLCIDPPCNRLLHQRSARVLMAPVIMQSAQQSCLHLRRHANNAGLLSMFTGCAPRQSLRYPLLKSTYVWHRKPSNYFRSQRRFCCASPRQQLSNVHCKREKIVIT